MRGEPPTVKEDLPFGAMQQFIIHLENLLILLARRCRRTKRPVAVYGGSAASICWSRMRAPTLPPTSHGS